MTSSTPSKHSPWLRAAASIPSAILIHLHRGCRLSNGRFVIERRLGSGGMGIVYAARDRAIGRRVAIKTLSRLSPAAVYRLKLEYRALADVTHPNLMKLYGLFQDQGRWFLVMELLEGETLAAFATGQPSIAIIRQLFAQVACGLSAIHAAGCVHRDLTPSNVMVVGDRAVIMDFGLVSEQGVGVPGQTIVDGQISGTPGYISPEQAAGRVVTPESDWYALGAMLRECLLAQAPKTVTRERNVPRGDELPSSSLRHAELSADLERLCSLLLQREPSRRASQTQVLTTLGAECDGSAPRPSARPRYLGSEREHELAALRDAYLATDEDQPAVVWLLGPRTCGKTALANDFLDGLREREDALIFCGRCDPRETLPYRALDGIIDACSRHLRTMSCTEARYLLPRGIDALCTLFPALGRIEGLLSGRGSRPTLRDTVRTRGVALKALKELLSRLSAHRPLVLFIDDLQHGDPESARLLAEILSPPEPPALLLIGGIRTVRERGAAGGAAAFTATLRVVPQLVVRELRLASSPKRATTSTRRSS